MCPCRYTALYILITCSVYYVYMFGYEYVGVLHVLIIKTCLMNHVLLVDNVSDIMQGVCDNIHP